MSSISTWWRGRGQHRAADRIPVLTHERDLWLMLALIQAHQLDYRQRQLAAANDQTTRLVTQVDGLTIERDDALNAWEIANALRHEAEADLANVRAITSPAPADGSRIVLRDPEQTVETPASALWDAIGNHPRPVAV